MVQRQCIAATTRAFSTCTLSRPASRTTPPRIHNQLSHQRRHLHQTQPRTTRTPLTHLQHTFPRRNTPKTRTFTTTPARSHGDLTPPKPGEERHVTFVDKDLQHHTFVVADGDNLLDIAQANDLEMEGACGGSCACSTCHVIVESDEMFDRMEEPSDDENDMLDLAFGLTETSRLGCQVVMRKELDGVVVKLPSMTRNMQASDFAEKS
ncbi:Adrenodoxin mitochondrial [Salinomyces thailandicus]|uniref:Adrenodoxin mitochondrial n=1 Tax=Salinomyces thailandicus TaxID=706561 RepID=A0A4U0TRC0_9PEZI|nr:Adrenodoxin mitochondrial [Salinomyces thailandica]